MYKYIQIKNEFYRGKQRYEPTNVTKLSNIGHTNRSYGIGNLGAKIPGEKVNKSFNLNSEKQDLNANKRAGKPKSKKLDKTKRHKNSIAKRFIDTSLANNGSLSSLKGW